MKTQSFIAGLTGLVIGAIGGYLVADRIYTKKFNEFVQDMIDAMPEEQQEEMGIVSPSKVFMEAAENGMKEANLDDIFGEKTEQEPIRSVDEVEEQQEKKEKVLYNKIEKNPEKDDISLPDGAYKWFKEHEGCRPFIIDEEERSKLITYGFDIEELTYYQNDDSLVDMEGKELEQIDISEMIDDCLYAEGWDQNDEEYLHVCNVDNRIIYLLTKKAEMMQQE